jgi:Spy/CpxP family protein refolding chaperone
MSTTFWTRRALLWGGGALAAAAALAMLTPRALAFRGFGGGFGGHGHGHRLFGDPERAKQHASVAVDWVLKTVDGSDEQRAQAKAIADRTIDALAPLAEKHKSFRATIAHELMKPTVDRAELERVRREEIKLADEASRLAVGALADFAEVLRPEQRAELMEWTARFHGR